MARPAKFVGAEKRKVVSLIRKNGLTGAQALLAEGVVLTKAKGRRKAKVLQTSVSLPTLGKLADAEGVVLNRGRRAAA